MLGGRVRMEMVTADVGPAGGLEVRVGDVATWLGRRGAESLSLNEHAARSRTIDCETPTPQPELCHAVTFRDESREDERLMSLFAGIYALTDEGRRPALPRSAVETVAATLSRFPGDTIQTYATPQLFLAHVDVGAFREPGWRVADGRVTACEPESHSGPRRRRRHGRKIWRGWPARLGADPAVVLRECRGTFALCHYEEASDALVLATDRLGVRPLYVHIGRRFLVFSTALRVLEAVEQVPKRVDLRGLTEEVVIGFPLADRTRYADIRVLESGEWLQAHYGVAPARSRYFRLEDVVPTEQSYEAFTDTAYERFLDAVACRCARDGMAISFLSGGLDSRCVVSALKALGKQIETISFDFADSPDSMIAEAFAQQIGSHHTVIPCLSGLAPHEQLTYGVGEPPSRVVAVDVAYPQLVFSGDGGSMGVGLIYMDDTGVRSLREGRVREVVEQHLGFSRLPKRMFRPAAYARLGLWRSRGFWTSYNGSRYATRPRGSSSSS